MRTQAGSSTRSATLPVMLTAMLGRERERAALRALMRDPAVRLVTITGPGGVGKTRLAVGAVSDAEDDLQVVFVPLAAIRDPERVVPAIGKAIGLNLEPGEGGDAALVSALASRNVLLVLDNLEQLSGVAPTIGGMIDQIPTLTILATSQVSLDVPGEHVFHLAPLPVPSATSHDVSDSEAVILFMQRARDVDPGLDLDKENAPVIAEICRRLDGLPLAIELAAARANLLSPAELLSRLNDRLGMLRMSRGEVDARHRTLRDAIGWTYDLLDPVEQALFRQVSVFAGGFSLSATRAVFSPSDGRDVAVVLDVLVRHSLLQPSASPDGAMRYVMLESLRAFGVDHLVQLGEELSAREAHATWVTRMAEEAGIHLRAGAQASWLAHLEFESENIRAAIEWSLGHDAHEITARILGSIWRFFGNRGMVTEARHWVTLALSGSSAVRPDTRADALVASGFLSLLFHRDPEDGERHMEQALHLAAAIGHKQAEMRAYSGLGIAAYDRGDYDRAIEMYTRGEAIARQLGSSGDIAIIISNLGLVLWQMDRVEETFAYWEEAVRLNAEGGDTITQALILANLGAVKNELGRFDEAEVHLRRALELQRSINDRSHVTTTLINYGENALLRGDPDAARARFLEARRVLRESGNAVFDAVATLGLAAVSLWDDDAPRSASLTLEAIDLLGNNREPARMLEIVETTAAVGGAAGQYDGAAEMLAAASQVRREHGVIALTVGVGNLEDLKAKARETLGDTAFDAVWKAGEVLDFDAMKSRARIIARQIVGRQVTGPEPTFRDNGPDATVSGLDYHLTRRELDVLRLLGEGKSTQEISVTLSVSPRTVGTHVANIMARMEVTSRTAAVARGIRDGVISPGAWPDAVRRSG